MSDSLLRITNLTTAFPLGNAEVKAIDGVSLSLMKGEILGLVGESGCGKSMTALSILGLVPAPGRMTADEIIFKGKDLLKLPAKALRRVRGREISMIFQEPTASLNPVFTIENQMIEALQAHGKITARRARKEAVEILDLVRIPEPEKKLKCYPHQLSGGMNQRVMIAMAVACRPELMIADEPTTALDVTIQAEILKLLVSLRKELDLSIILITHDLSIISGVADRVVVMYTGKVVEDVEVNTLFSSPAHPYTEGLLNSIPRVVCGQNASEKKLKTIPGSVPEARALPPGCSFHPRCPYAFPRCSKVSPAMKALSETQKVYCHRYLEEE